MVSESPTPSTSKLNNPFLTERFENETSSSGSIDTPSSNIIESTNESNESEILVSSPSNPSTYLSTSIPNIKDYPFKTLNRILDDIRWTIPYQLKYSQKILNSKPILYSNNLSKLTGQLDCTLLILNNSLLFSPSSEEIQLALQTLLIIRGLIVNQYNEVHHFRINVLQNFSNPFVSEKHEYHVIPRDLISKDDLESLRYTPDEDLLDDAYFKTTSHILRVSIFKQELSSDDLHSLTDKKTIEDRYLKALEKHPNLSPETIPTTFNCFKTLIKVLKGPILLVPGETIKTISLENTVLDTQIDIDFVLNSLHFQLKNSDLVPPTLTPALRESYIRKIQELLYLGRVYALARGESNDDFVTTYSYSDNLSLVFIKIPEYDKQSNLLHFKNQNSNQYSFLTNLSICGYFQDELILKCFENTITSDFENRHHYVDSLKSVINYRGNASSKLTKYMTNLTMNGDLVGWTDFVEALRILDLVSDDPLNLDDDVILSMYNSSVNKDSKNYAYFNRQLVTIAKAKSSSKIFDFVENEILPYEMSMDELGIENITEDEVVITAYEFKLDDIMQLNNFNTNTAEVKLLHRALISIGVQRKSFLLLHYIETKLPQLMKVPEQVTYLGAFDKLGCSPSSNDLEIFSNFQQKLMYSDIDVRTLRFSLRVIAEGRKSENIIQFLRTGKNDQSLLPAQDWPTGLDNIGNTCYLNSLLQYYFCLKPLRDLILTFEEKEIKETTRKIGGRKVEESEIQRSSQFIYHLRRLFEEMIHSEKRCVEPSKELAYLSFLHLSQPVTFHVNGPEIIEVEDMEDIQHDSNEITTEHSNESSNLIELDDNDVQVFDVEDVDSESSDEVHVDVQEMEEVQETGVYVPKKVSAVQAVASESAQVVPQTHADSAQVQAALGQILPISTDQMESTIEVGRQQDVTECIENVIFQIETALEPESLDDDGEQIDLIKKLFYGKTKQTITPINSNIKARESFERFFSLIINVSDHPKDIYDSLDSYFSDDLVNLEEGLVKKSITITEMPEILQFHVQRVMFDREKLVAYKSIEPIPFSETIYLDRYLDTDDEEILTKRNEVFRWKSQISALNQRKENILKVDETTGLNIIDSLLTSEKYIESKVVFNDALSINTSTIKAIAEKARALKQELSNIDAELQNLGGLVTGQFSKYKKIGYSVFAIFIHRGEASYGHYWIYIKDPISNMYRKYNDEIVTEVPSSEVFNFLEGNTATPYYIVYVKDELKESYIEPLKRVIR